METDTLSEKLRLLNESLNTEQLELAGNTISNLVNSEMWLHIPQDYLIESIKNVEHISQLQGYMGEIIEKFEKGRKQLEQLQSHDAALTQVISSLQGSTGAATPKSEN